MINSPWINTSVYYTPCVVDDKGLSGRGLKEAKLSSTPYSSFEPQRALLLVTLCYQMYFQWEKGYFILPVWPKRYKTVGLFQGPTLTNKTEDIGVVLESDDSVIVVFRGTRNMNEIIQDVNAFHTPYTLVPNAGEVSRGFYSVYTDPLPMGSVRDQVLRLLDQVDATKKLYITGHSLGGSLATLNALDVAYNSKFKQPIIYTYGSPRTGDETFVKKFNKTLRTSFRVYNKYDLVPDLPPCQFGYRHVKLRYELAVDAGNPATNHDIVTAYYPGLAEADPTFAKNLCEKNPPDFCAKPLAPGFLIPILYPKAAGLQGCNMIGRRA